MEAPLKFRAIAVCLVFCSFLSLLSSCSTPRPEGQTEAEVLYLEAKEQFERRRFLLATERLNLLRSRYPYSFYAAPAELLQADILFEQGSYAEAAAAYSLFRDFHPRHERIAYVVYRIAESYYQQIPSTYDRDLQPAREAITFYRELINRFSESEYAQQARDKILEAEEMLKNRERYVADFYFRTKVYDSAKFRYKEILANFSDKDLRDEAMLRIVESSYRLKEFDECQNYFSAFKNQISESNKRRLERLANNCIQ